MSEDNIEEIPDARSFEERVNARFDSVDLRIDSTNSRLDAVESRLVTMDSHAQPSKGKSECEYVEEQHIWERALAQLEELAMEFRKFRVEVRSAFGDLSCKIDVLGNDMIQLRANHIRHETRLNKLESEFRS